MMLQKIKISLIKQDGGTQSRDKMSPDVIKEYAASMTEGAEFPPVVLFFDGETYWLGDGFHRVAAAIDAKQKTISAEVHEGGFRDAILFAVGANASHGLRRTNADKRRSVSRLLDDQEWSQWSDREIARRCGVSHPFVMQMRSERVVTVTTPKAGKVSTVDTPKPKPEPTPAPEIDTEAQIEANQSAMLDEAQEADIQPEPEAPAAPPVSNPVKGLNAEALKAENEDLKERLEEMAFLMAGLQEELEAARRILDAEDLASQFAKEVKRAQAQANVTQSRNNGLMNENADLKGRLKSALRKIEKLEKAVKGLAA